MKQSHCFVDSNVYSQRFRYANSFTVAQMLVKEWFTDAETQTLPGKKPNTAVCFSSGG